ncbi:MAG: hypothetical protein JXJ22_11125 [Bacteroidales bacterium]|nr:hypothetical protein [Bacteroidales bacterium]
MKKVTVLLFFFIICNVASSQNFYSIGGEYTVKNKSDGASQLIVGRFYYNINDQYIVHENSFPEKEVYVTADTNLFQINNGKVESRTTIPDLTHFSIYHLALNQQLSNYGLEGSIYKLENVDKEDDLVISTWIPDKNFKKNFGKILLSTKNKQLFGIVFFDNLENVIKKQFFEEYVNSMGLSFPSKVIEIAYVNNKEIIQVTTYKNITINDVPESYIRYTDLIHSY